MSWNDEGKDAIAEFLRAMEKYPPITGELKPFDMETMLAKALIQLCKERNESSGNR